MLELVEANWPVVAILLVLAILTLLWVFLRNRKARVEVEDRSGEKTPPRRNQALIDAPPAAATAVMSAANNHDVAKAPAATDAEAGPAITPTRAPPSALATDGADPPAPETSGDDLSRIKGVGPKLVSQLNDLGVTSFAQIAAWDEAGIDRIDAQLGRFKGRIRRDQWVEQAKLLAEGDIGQFEQHFGRT